MKQILLLLALALATPVLASEKPQDLGTKRVNQKQKLKNISTKDTARIIAGAACCVGSYFVAQQAKNSWQQCTEQISAKGAMNGGWAAAKDAFWTMLGHRNPGNVVAFGQDFGKKAVLTVGWTSSTLLLGALGIRMIAKGLHVTDEDEEDEENRNNQMYRKNNQ